MGVRSSDADGENSEVTAGQMGGNEKQHETGEGSRNRKSDVRHFHTENLFFPCSTVPTNIAHTKSKVLHRRILFSRGPWHPLPHAAAPCAGTRGALNTLLARNITLMSPSISFKWRLMKSEGRQHNTHFSGCCRCVCACASLPRAAISDTPTGTRV